MASMLFCQVLTYLIKYYYVLTYAYCFDILRVIGLSIENMDFEMCPQITAQSVK